MLSSRALFLIKGVAVQPSEVRLGIAVYHTRKYMPGIIIDVTIRHDYRDLIKVCSSNDIIYEAFLDLLERYRPNIHREEY